MKTNYNYKKDFEEDEVPHKPISIWIKPWKLEDYKTYEHELLKIHSEYLECKKIADADERWKTNKKIPRYFATDIFQIRNGGMNDKFVLRYDKSLTHQIFTVNQAKIKKYFNWLEYSKTRYEGIYDEDVSKERFAIIRNMLVKLSTSKV